MNIPISELVDTCFPEQVRLGEPDAAMTDRIKMNVNERKQKSKRRVPLAILVAAIMIALTVGTVYAVVYSRMTVRNVSDETIGMHTLMRNGEVGYLEWKNASIGFEFMIEGECREVYFRPGWLPAPLENQDNQNADGWMTYARSSIADRSVIFEIGLYWGDRLRDKTFFISNDAEIVKEDIWNGYNRTEVRVDNGLGKSDTNYVILFSETDNYMICICGSPDFETMEQMAEELEIHVTEDLVDEKDAADDVLFESQPLDMEGDSYVRDDAEMAENSLHYTFDVSQTGRKVFFRTNWLPDQENVEDDRWRTSLLPDDGMDYGVRMYWVDSLYNRVFYFRATDGKAEVVKDDVWNGLRRIEVAVTERYSDLMESYQTAIDSGARDKEDFRVQDQNHILLFHETEGWLVHIDGYADMETLEEIAENMEYRVTETEISAASGKETEYYDISGRGYLPGVLESYYGNTPDVPDLTYTFEGLDVPQYEAVFYAGWLPEEPTEDNRDDYDCATWMRHHVDGDQSNVLYSINLWQEQWTDGVEEIRFYADGVTSVLKETTYNGMTAVVIVTTDRYDTVAMSAYEYEISEGTMDKEEFRLPDTYEIFFYSDEADCMVWVGGDCGLETLERIVENLDIRLTKRDF